MEKGVRYYFFLNDGTKLTDSDGPKLYEQLIADAHSKIVIWDPYIHDDDIALLSHITGADNLVMLTNASSAAATSSPSNWITKREALYNQLKIQVPATKKPTLKVSLAYIDKAVHGGDNWKCHDRFLIIDDSDYYLIGSSMEHHRKLRSSTGIMHIEHQADKEIIKNAFAKVYAEANSHGWIADYPNLL